jgi:hypothetical protein
MSIFFSTDDRPCCKFCGQQLPGYAESGHCPHCGKWFSADRASIGPSRIRAIALLARSTPAVFGRVPSIWTGVAAALFITINAGIVILLGHLAVRSLYHACGMTP